MSEALQAAEKALAIVRDYPPHVKQREQAVCLKELAEHVIRLAAEVERMMPLVEAVGGCQPGEVPESVYLAWKQLSEYKRPCVECGSRL